MKNEMVPIELDKPRHLVYDMDAVYDLEKIYGSFTKAVRSVRIDAFDDTARLLYFGLRHEDSTMTEVAAGQLIDVTNRLLVIDRIIRAVSVSMPDIKATQKSIPITSTRHSDDPWEWDWLYYIGTVLLRMSEAVFWRCTPRKFFALWAIHRKINGLDPVESPEYKQTQAWIDQYI